MNAISKHSLLSGLIFALAGTSSAYAVDGQAFAERLRQVVNGDTAAFAFSNVTTDGEDVILNGVTLTPSAPGATPMPLGDVQFDAVTGSDAEGWRAERVTVPDSDQTEDGMRVTTAGVGMTGLEIKGTAAAAPSLAPISFEDATVASIAVERGGQSVAEVDNVRVRNQTTSNDGLASTFEIGQFRVTPPAPAGGSNVLGELGYETLSGDLSGNAAWNPQDGTLTLDPLQVEVENAGALNFSYTITGYTPSFIQSLAQVSEQMRATGGQSDQSGMAVIGLISQLYLRSAQLEFDDRSLTGRVLDYYAKQNNQTREQLVANLTNMMPMALSYLQNPEFQASVAAALSDYLNDPQSLRLSIAPAAPIPATQIIGAAMGAPQTLPQVLNLTVESGN